MKKMLRRIFSWQNSARGSLFQALVNFKALAPIEQQSGILGGLYSSPDFSTFFQRLFVFALSLGAILAVARLMWAGYLYMGKDYWDKKNKAKEIFQGVIFGLLLLLAIWVILNTINPQLLNLNVLNSIKSQPAKNLSPGADAQATKAICTGVSSYCDSDSGQSLIGAP